MKADRLIVTLYCVKETHREKPRAGFRFKVKTPTPTPTPKQSKIGRMCGKKEKQPCQKTW